jgi:hypothetical protein
LATDSASPVRSRAKRTGWPCQWLGRRERMSSRQASWRGMIHGGVIALMPDEAVGWAGWHFGPSRPDRLPGGALPAALRLGERAGSSAAWIGSAGP